MQNWYTRINKQRVQMKPLDFLFNYREKRSRLFKFFIKNVQCLHDDRACN